MHDEIERPDSEQFKAAAEKQREHWRTLLDKLAQE